MVDFFMTMTKPMLTLIMSDVAELFDNSSHLFYVFVLY